MHNKVLLNHEQEWNYVIHRKMDANEEHCVKQINTDSEKYEFFLICRI
jgi:hypothetical protein